MRRMGRIQFLGSVFVLMMSTAVLGKGPQGIQYTKHNLGSGGWFAGATNEDEVCIFCHTPHGGDLNGPLWNRDLSGFLTKAYTHYNSATLSDEVKNSRPAGSIVNAESALCLSCHDGSVAANQIINTSSAAGALPDNNFEIRIGVAGGSPGPRIGAINPADLVTTNNLSDDHPISFSYSSVVAGTKYTDATSPFSGQLRSEIQALSQGVRFFGSDSRMECSSCHDPHVDYGDSDVGTSPGVGNSAYTAYAPFLITSNQGSGLCFACHVK